MARQSVLWDNGGGKPPRPPEPPDYKESIDFLEQLRPGGPWVLTAIIPDGQTETRTVTDLAAARKFIAEHNGKRNLYYSINPTKTPISKKAAKADIAQAEFVHADLDPRDGETSEQAKARCLGHLETFKPTATAIIDSGNGIQALWRFLFVWNIGSARQSEDAVDILSTGSAAQGEGHRQTACFDFGKVFR